MQGSGSGSPSAAVCEASGCGRTPPSAGDADLVRQILPVRQAWCSAPSPSLPGAIVPLILVSVVHTKRISGAVRQGDRHHPLRGVHLRHVARRRGHLVVAGARQRSERECQSQEQRGRSNVFRMDSLLRRPKQGFRGSHFRRRRRGTAARFDRRGQRIPRIRRFSFESPEVATCRDAGRNRSFGSSETTRKDERAGSRGLAVRPHRRAREDRWRSSA